MVYYFEALIRSPHISISNLLFNWQNQPLSLISLFIEITSIAFYFFGTKRLSKKGRSWSKWKTLSYIAGITTIVIAVQSGLASYDDTNFSVHVVQHILLMAIAPIFLSLSAPVTLALQALKRNNQVRLLKVINSPIIKLITFPLVGASIYYFTPVLFFLTPLYPYSLVHPVVHELTHLEFLIAGMLFWWPIIGLDSEKWRFPHGAKIISLFVGMPFDAFIGISIMNLSHSIAPQHTLADTRVGGAILWGAGETITVAAIMIILLQWMRQDAKEAVRIDRQLDAQRHKDQLEQKRLIQQLDNSQDKEELPPWAAAHNTWYKNPNPEQNT